jgi:hypothetical protein
MDEQNRDRNTGMDRDRQSEQGGTRDDTGMGQGGSQAQDPEMRLPGANQSGTPGTDEDIDGGTQTGSDPQGNR